ncbi:ATP-binding protein [Sedimenticola selenatireducens]|uniref:C4-dicarboxylate transport sensor protein DctB n=1 Tax=Sedimenticola selenatireducens TaxID=191960 RepID=A0A557SKN3_9GAMM|nr:ATP-binding protein [Sedimenticola selenatireducens]TVO77882.1 sensor histidine kinase [Sedimenticola selenatireducens]TVT65187.1 MAG: sensor histidine kinase [Sedimenticola selenatireducens]
MNHSTAAVVTTEGHKSPLGKYLLILVTTLILGSLLSIGLTQWTEQQHFESLDQQGNARLELYASTVQAAKQRFDYLPYIVSRDQQVGLLLSERRDQLAVNKKLKSWQIESGAAVLYLMDQTGEVVASSNWQEQKSFVGNNYHFRPYFQDAIAGNTGQFFAVGASTGEPGLFLSRPVFQGKQIIGVAVVKIDMTQLEHDWTRGGERVLVADNDGIIFLSSNPQWKYNSLSMIDASTLDRLTAEKKYGSSLITPLNILEQKVSPLGHRIIKLARDNQSTSEDKNFLLHQRPISDLNWTLYYLSDLTDLASRKRSALLIGMLFTILLILLTVIIVNRSQSRRLLEVRVAKRTQALNETNSQLIKEINSRIQTEEQLRQTHEELIQAEKLAALGQMSAGIVHEISQPLSAMQTFAASARLLLQREDKQSALENLDDISNMIRRVSSIVSHLKNFASKSRDITTSIEINNVINNALLILRPRLDKATLVLDIQPTKSPCFVVADEIKLEQILINLIRNALDAMEQSGQEPPHQLRIWIESNDEKTDLLIADNGPGIDPDDLPRVFDPFFTTKPPGEGLGLGLSVSYGIAKAFGGDLTVVEHTAEGTLFKLSLDTAPAPESLHD